VWSTKYHGGFLKKKGTKVLKEFSRNVLEILTKEMRYALMPPVSLLSDDHFKEGEGKRRWPTSGCSFGDLHGPICEAAIGPSRF
jgi:hypothetical protein